MFVLLHRLSRWTSSLDNYLKGFERWVHASVWGGTRELRPPLLLSIINQTHKIMQYSDVLQFNHSAGKVDESTKALMLWVATEKGELEACVLGDSPELLLMYRSIFMGVLPIARVQGWLKD